MIQYKVKDTQVERNLALLRAAYDEIRAIQPDGLREATFQLEDRVSFVAFVEIDDPSVLARIPAFQTYRRTLDERCDEPPAVTPLREIGSFRFR